MSFKEEFEKVDAQVKEETGYNLAGAVGVGVVTLTFLVKAVRAAKRGDYQRAIFFAILWHSYKSSSDDKMTRHLITKQSKPAPKKSLWDVNPRVYR